MPKIDDIVVTFVPEAWSATQLVRAVGRTEGLVTGIVIVGWCGTRELRLVRGRDVDRLARRLTPVVDLVVAAQRPAAGPAAGDHPLTLTNVPDGHRVFDELGMGRKIVVAELAQPGHAGMQRWLRVLAVTAQRAASGDLPIASCERAMFTTIVAAETRIDSSGRARSRPRVEEQLALDSSV